MIGNGQKCGFVCFDNRQVARICLGDVARTVSDRPFIVSMLVHKRPSVQPSVVINSSYPSASFYKYLSRLHSESRKSIVLHESFTSPFFLFKKLKPLPTMAPSAQSSVLPSSNALTAQVRQWIPGNHQDLYTYGLSECNVIATWTAEGNNTLMHVTGQDVNECVTKLVNQIKSTQSTIYVIAVAGPDNATET